MRIRSQLFIDKYLGQPAGLILNAIVRLTGKVLHINHSLDRDFQRIAVVKYKGFGSMVQSKPLLRALKTRYPDSRITFITSIQNKHLVELLEDVDDGIFFDDRTSLRALTRLPVFLWEMWQHRFQLLFDLELYSNISSILSTLSCSTNRFGFFLSSSQFRMGLYTHMMFFNTRCPLSETYFQMARCLGIQTSDTHPAPLYAPETNELKDLTRPYFVINVNASDLRVERRWPSSSFAELSDRLESQYPSHHQYFIGSASERSYVDQTLSYKKSLLQKCTSLAGKTSLKELIALISGADLLITCDTGPAHLGYAQGCKAVVLFGPVSPHQFYIPHNTGVIYKNVYCSPCIHEFDTPPCKGDNQCMKQITVDEVMLKAETVLRNDDQRAVFAENMKYTTSGGGALGKVIR